MKVRIKPHPAVWNELKIVGLPYWYNLGTKDGRVQYRKVMIMLEPEKKELLSANEQKSYEPVSEVIEEREKVIPSILEDKRLIIEEYDDENLPKTRRQSKGGDS